MLNYIKHEKGGGSVTSISYRYLDSRIFGPIWLWSHIFGLRRFRVPSSLNPLRPFLFHWTSSLWFRALLALTLALAFTLLCFVPLTTLSNTQYSYNLFLFPNYKSTVITVAEDTQHSKFFWITVTNHREIPISVRSNSQIQDLTTTTKPQSPIDGLTIPNPWFATETYYQILDLRKFLHIRLKNFIHDGFHSNEGVVYPGRLHKHIY